jgi:hypothetical protein
MQSPGSREHDILLSGHLNWIRKQKVRCLQARALQVTNEILQPGLHSPSFRGRFASDRHRMRRAKTPALGLRTPVIAVVTEPRSGASASQTREDEPCCRAAVLPALLMTWFCTGHDCGSVISSRPRSRGFFTKMPCPLSSSSNAASPGYHSDRHNRYPHLSQKPGNWTESGSFCKVTASQNPAPSF